MTPRSRTAPGDLPVGTDDDHQRRLGAGVGVVAEVADATRQDEPDVALRRLVHVDGLHRGVDARAERGIVQRHRETNGGGGGAETAEVTIAQERPAVVGAQRFVDPGPVEETMVEDRDGRLAVVREAPVDVDGDAHASFVT